MKLSEKAMDLSSEVYNSIINHQFNKELYSGNLSRQRVTYYIEQSAIYLGEFARCNAIIAAKVDTVYMRNFLRYAEYALHIEQEITHGHFKKCHDFIETYTISPATLGYTSYLMGTCYSYPVEISIAAVVPHFFVNSAVSLFMSKNSTNTEMYADLINLHASQQFIHMKSEIIELFDQIASKSLEHTKEQMLCAFYRSVCLELHFLEDIYFEQVIESL